MNGARRVYVIVGVVLLAALVIVLFGGCKSNAGKIRHTAAGTTLFGVEDAGKPATLASEQSAAVLTLPAGSRLTTVKESASPAVPATETSAAIPAKPAREVTEVTLSRDTTWRKDESKIAADTGVVDTTVALKRIQAGENRYLLFAAIGAAIAALLFVYIKYPTPALMCGAASVVFFLAWKLADLPDWFYVVGVVGSVAAVVMWKAHERGEKDEREAKAIAVPVDPPRSP